MDTRNTWYTGIHAGKTPICRNIPERLKVLLKTRMTPRGIHVPPRTVALTYAYLSIVLENISGRGHPPSERTGDPARVQPIYMSHGNMKISSRSPRHPGDCTNIFAMLDVLAFAGQCLEGLTDSPHLGKWSPRGTR